MAASQWGDKRSKAMNTLNWEKLPTFKAGRTLWSSEGAAATGLESLLGKGNSLDLNVNSLEEMFARPDIKPRAMTVAGDAPKVNKVQLLDQKRSTDVGIVMKVITDALQGKELRDALLEVDENLLSLEVLKRVLKITPTAEERALLTGFSGDVLTLDRPEQMMRTLAHIPRLEGRLVSMMFKQQLEVDLEEVMLRPVDKLRAACEAVRDCKELHALFRIVLDVGNALNAGTSKGNAVGFKLSTLLKLADLKAADKKRTLLHFVVEVVRKNAPAIHPAVVELQKLCADATRVSLEELGGKKAETEKGLNQVDGEITWHDEQRLREGDAAQEDDFPEVFTEFFNYAAERKDAFDEKLANAKALFRAACELLGEGEAQEPNEVFETLEKFVARFAATTSEIDEEHRKAEQSAQGKLAAQKKKQLKNPRPSHVPGKALRVNFRKGSGVAATPDHMVPHKGANPPS